MDIYKLWLTKYKDNEDITLFAKLNSDEVIGILKVWYIIRSMIPHFVFTINKSAAAISLSNKNVYSNYYRDILPYTKNRDLDFYIKKYALHNRIYIVISLLLKNIVKEYLLFLDNMSQLYGCLLAFQIFNVDKGEIIDSGDIISGKVQKINIADINFETRLVNSR